MNAGLEPGLRFACLLDGRGGCAEMDWKGVAAWRPEQGFLWIHLERDVPDAMRWITEASGVEPLVAQALLDDESRPTIESFDAALLLVLRGVNLAEKDEVELVPIHIWIDQHRAITLRDKEHALSALRDIRIALQCGRGPRKPGGLLVQICEKIVRDTGPSVEEMDDEVEHLEDLLAGTASKELRRDLAELRRRAVHLRRFLGPQREALIRLQTEDTLLLDKSDRMRLRCVIDSVIRYLEDMDALRDRTTIFARGTRGADLGENRPHIQSSHRGGGTAAAAKPGRRHAGRQHRRYSRPAEPDRVLGDEPGNAGSDAGAGCRTTPHRLAVERGNDSGWT